MSFSTLPEDLIIYIIELDDSAQASFALMGCNTYFKRIVTDNIFNVNILGINPIQFINIITRIFNKTKIYSYRKRYLFHLLYQVRIDCDNTLRWKGNINILIWKIYGLITCNNIKKEQIYNELINLREGVTKTFEENDFVNYIFKNMFKKTYYKPQVYIGTQIY